MLYNFAGGSADGASPYARLINVRRTLYGTTIDGVRRATEPSSRSRRPVRKPYSTASRVNQTAPAHKQV